MALNGFFVSTENAVNELSADFNTLNNSLDGTTKEAEEISETFPLDVFKEAALDEPIETLFTLVAKNIFIHVIRDTQKLVDKTGSSIRDFSYNRALIEEMIDKSIVKGCSC